MNLKEGTNARRQNVILTFASNYSYYEIQPFVESWRKYENTTLYLFYLDLSSWTKNCLESMGVHLVEVSPSYRKNPENIGYTKIAVITSFLKKNRERFHQILYVDVRDVIFQKKFFTSCSEDYLEFSSQNHNVEKAAEFDWVVKICKGDLKKAESVRGKEILNGGVYCGTIEKMIGFMEKLLEGGKDLGYYLGFDQGGLTYFAHNKLLNTENIRIDSAFSGPLSSIYHVRNEMKIEGDYITGPLGDIPAVLHQYDRVPAFCDFVNKHYRTTIINTHVTYTLDVRSKLEQIKFLMCNKKYIEALNAAMTLQNLKTKSDISPVCFDHVTQILQKGSKENVILVRFTLECVLEFLRNRLFDFLSQRTQQKDIDSCMQFLYTVISKPFTSILEDFHDDIQSLLEKDIKESNYGRAFKWLLLLENISVSKNEAFYLSAAKVYAKKKLVKSTMRCYEAACNLQCRPIFLLGTHMETYLCIDEQMRLVHLMLLPGKDICEVARKCGHYLVYVMQSNNVFSLFIIREEKLQYICSLGTNGTVVLDERPRYRTFKVFDNNIVAVSEGDGYWSASIDYSIKVAQHAWGWEKFRMFPASYTEHIYALMDKECDI